MSQYDLSIKTSHSRPVSSSVMSGKTIGVDSIKTKSSKAVGSLSLLADEKAIPPGSSRQRNVLPKPIKKKKTTLSKGVLQNGTHGSRLKTDESQATFSVRDTDSNTSIRFRSNPHSHRLSLSSVGVGLERKSRIIHPIRLNS